MVCDTFALDHHVPRVLSLFGLLLSYRLADFLSLPKNCGLFTRGCFPFSQDSMEIAISGDL